MTVALLIVLTVALVAVGLLVLDVRDLGKKLRAAQGQADDAADDAERSRGRKALAEEHRDRVVLAYGAVLAEVQEVALHLQANKEPFVAARLQRLADERLGELRRLG